MGYTRHARSLYKLIMLLSLVSRYGAGQLKVMFVGGPNVRKDYHIDEGEEVRESSFNMTRGGDEDIETPSLKF